MTLIFTFYRIAIVVRNQQALLNNTNKYLVLNYKKIKTEKGSVKVDTNFIKKVALSGLILGAAFTVVVPSYAAENATVVITEDGKEKIFTGISKEALHIRSGASVTETSLAILPKGTFVKGTVYETEATKENPYKEWVKIKYLDIEGYIAKDFLKEAAGNQAKSAPAKVKNVVSTPKKAVVAAKKLEKAPVKETKKYVQKAEAVSKKAAAAEEKAPVKESKLAAEEVSVQKENAPVAKKAVQEAPVKEEALVSETPAVEEKAWTSGNENEEVQTPVQEEAPVQEAPVKEEAPVQETPVKEEAPVQETPVKEEAPVQETPVKEEAPVQEAPVKEEAPVQEAPVKEEAPVQETPVVEEPVQEKPAQENNSGSYTTQMQATAYTATGNRTATGTVPKKGTIAVDPDVIPLGTELYVEGYGNGIAEDTGSAVKGNIIDLYMDSEQQARDWGRRNVNVTIYNYK